MPPTTLHTAYPPLDGGDMGGRMDPPMGCYTHFHIGANFFLIEINFFNGKQCLIILLYIYIRMENKTKIKITGKPPGDVPMKIVLQKFCLLRNAKQVGDIEVINNTQLGRLKDHNVPFEIINEVNNTKKTFKEQMDTFKKFLLIVKEFHDIKNQHPESDLGGNGVNDKKLLINILKKETESLKTQYIEKTKEWCNGYFDIMSKKSKWNDEQWANWLGVPTQIKTTSPFGGEEYITFGEIFWKSGAGYMKTYYREKDECYRITNMGLEKLIEKEVKNAELHYENSIEKLAYRILMKNLDISKLKVKTSHIGVNINTTLTDGNKIVKAFTIIASGPIQKPHYRYLVK